MIIRPYKETDENGWLRCRVLAFLNTAYFDNVLNQKEKYTNKSIELVAEENNEIIGLIDVEIDTINSPVCSEGRGLGAMVWHIAVHPDHQRRGLGQLLLNSIQERLSVLGVQRLEAYTRDDIGVNDWYERNDFVKVSTYHHVYFEEGTQMKGFVKSEFPQLYLCTAFAHYLGDDIEVIKTKASRVHACHLYAKTL